VRVDYNVCRAVGEFKAYHTQWNFSTGFTREIIYLFLLILRNGTVSTFKAMCIS